MYKFESLYSAVVTASLLAGFCFPGTKVKQEQKWRNAIVQFYSVLSTAPLFYVIVCNLILLYTGGGLDLKLYGINTIVIVTVLDTYYYLLRKKEFHSLLENIDIVTDNMLRSKLIKDGHATFILSKAKRFNSLSKWLMVLIVFQNASAPICLMFLYFLYSQSHVFINVPYSLSSLPLLFVTWILHMFAGLYASPKIVCFWGVIFLFLFHMVSYLKALRESLSYSFTVEKHDQNLRNISATLYSVKNEGPISCDNEPVSQNNYKSHIQIEHGDYVLHNLREWIQLHQSVLMLIKQFNKLYSPLLLVHLLNFYANGLTSVFAATVQKEGMSFSLTMLSYVGVELLAFLAICSFGTELTYECSRVFENGYSVAFLSWNKAISSSSLIIGEMVNKPVIISVYGSEYFNLQLQAFVMIVQSMVSFYIGLSQMEKLNNNYNNAQ